MANIIDDIQKWEFERDRYQIEKIKATLTLASGTLIVSLGIINTKIPSLKYKGVLFTSWIFLIFSIIIGIFAIDAGVKRYARAVEGKKGELRGKEKELYEKGKVLTTFEAKTVDVQINSFVIGLIIFFLFVVLNIYSAISW